MAVLGGAFATLAWARVARPEIGVRVHLRRLYGKDYFKDSFARFGVEGFWGLCEQSLWPIRARYTHRHKDLYNRLFR